MSFLKCNRCGCLVWEQSENWDVCEYCEATVCDSCRVVHYDKDKEMFIAVCKECLNAEI